MRPTTATGRVLARLRHQLQRSAAKRAGVPGRDQHRARRPGILRGRGQAAGVVPHRQPRADLVVRRARAVADAVPRAASYVVPKIDVQISATLQFKPGTLGIAGNAGHQRRVDRRQLCGTQPRDSAVARTAADRWTGQRQHVGQHAVARPALWRSREPVGRAPGQGAALRADRTLVGVDLYNLFNANPA